MFPWWRLSNLENISDFQAQNFNFSLFRTAEKSSELLGGRNTIPAASASLQKEITLRHDTLLLTKTGFIIVTGLKAVLHKNPPKVRDLVLLCSQPRVKPLKCKWAPWSIKSSSQQGKLYNKKRERLIELMLMMTQWKMKNTRSQGFTQLRLDSHRCVVPFISMGKV